MDDEVPGQRRMFFGDDVPDYNPDAPSHRDINSREAAEDAAQTARRLEAKILEHIREFGPSTCTELHVVHPEKKHESVSARVNVMHYDRRSIYRIGRRKNERGRYEWIYDEMPT